MVSQEPTLYAGSVRFNILLGAVKPASEVTQEEIEDACRHANILDFINSLPEYVLSLSFNSFLRLTYCFSGFDTEVGGKGSQLSGGQKRVFCLYAESGGMTLIVTFPCRTHCYCPSTAS